MNNTSNELYSFNLFRVPRDDTSYSLTVAICFIWQNSELLLVQKAKDPFKGKWCIPGGKIEKDESLEDGLIREIKEEIGYNLTHDELNFFTSYYVHYSSYRYRIAVFYSQLSHQSINIKLSDNELTNFSWVKNDDFFSWDLIPGEEQIFTDLRNALQVDYAAI